MKFCLGLFAASALGFISTPALAQFQLLPPNGSPVDTVISFAMPQDRDPTRLTFTQQGQVYTRADNAGPGHNAGSVLTGQLLQTNGVGAGGGLELHGQFPAVYPIPVFTPALEVDFYTTYTGNLEIDSIVVSPFTGFTPWDVQRIAPRPGYAQAFRFTGGRPGQAPLFTGVSLSGYYALLSARLNNASDPTGFGASTFAFTGFATIQPVPEPGSLLLLGGLVFSGASLMRRRSRRGMNTPCPQ